MGQKLNTVSMLLGIFLVLINELCQQFRQTLHFPMSLYVVSAFLPTLLKWSQFLVYLVGELLEIFYLPQYYSKSVSGNIDS